MSVGHDDVVRWVGAFAEAIAENKEYLTALDAAIGDADHGINMNRGMQTVMAKLQAGDPEDIGALLKTVGMALVSSVGGAGGPLYGTFFLQLGSKAIGKDELTDDDWVAMLAAAVEGVQMRGKAEPNDKTMVDALIPARDASGRGRGCWRTVRRRTARVRRCRGGRHEGDHPPRRTEGTRELPG